MGEGTMKPGEIAPQESHNKRSPETNDHDQRWQITLLPYMSAGVALLGLVYFVLGIYSVSGIGRFLQEEPTTHVTARVDALLATRTKDHLTNADMMQQGLLLLEADTLERRYRQASALL